MPDPAFQPRPGAHVALETTEPTAAGRGFISGLLSAILGIAGLGLVLGLRFPEYLRLADLRPLYSSPYLRAAVHVTLVTLFLLGSVSAVLRANKALAFAGIGATLAAALLGGSQLPVTGAVQGKASWLAADFFVLNLVLYSAVFIPLERLFALRADQPVFRRHWLVDLTYFFINSLLMEVLTILTLQPALILFDWARGGWVSSLVASLPVFVQVPVIVCVADFTQYWVHRTFHAVPFLWRFHAIHHSAVLGFSNAALMAYVFLVAVQATFIHANVRWQFRAVRRVVATPAFHHWHHSADSEAVDKNFSVHTPVWDILFRTYYLPDRWPTRYGLSGPRDVPSGWLRQLLYPIARRPRG